ncbi:MAG TPA: Xaa-Pro aminopeptidase [Gemmatimonadales bacterium]
MRHVRAILALSAVPLGPLAAQSTVWPPAVPALPGAGRPVDRAETAARRARLLARVGQGVVVIASGTQRDLEADVLQDNDFRPNDYFFYLTGIETPDAVLVLAARRDGPDETFLLLPERNPRREQWTGATLGPGPEAAAETGIEAVLRVRAADSLIPALSRLIAGPLYVTQEPAGAGAGAMETRNVGPILDSLRVVKDEAELRRLRHAAEITAEAQRAAMTAAAPGMYEYQLEAVIEFTFRNLGADRVGFPSIVGSGPNSTTLHYDANRRLMGDGDLVVMDVGAEFGQYTADVTRTIPVNGRFSDRQRAIYELVLGTQQAAIDAVRPGVTLPELSAVARSYMRQHSGALCGARTCDAYFIHGLSHWLGMRVHDVGDYAMPLAPGMVLTIEPGIYLPDEQLGVRIEDDVVVTERGAEVLSAGAPRTTEDIEALMAGGHDTRARRRN